MDKDLTYIKKYSKITIKNVCDECGVKPNNLWSGKLPKSKINMIRKCIEAKMAALYIEEFDYGKSKTGSLQSK